jgi:hypothetical protein
MQHECGVSPAREFQRTRAPLSLEHDSLSCPSRAFGDAFEVARAFREARLRAPGRRGRDASDRLLHSEPIKLEYRSFAVSQRCGCWKIGPFSPLTRLPHSCRASRLVPIRAEASTSAIPLYPPEGARRGLRLARGQNRMNEAGGRCSSHCDTHFDDRANAA